MPLAIPMGSNTASTIDWLRATENIIISAYEPVLDLPLATVVEVPAIDAVAQSQDDALFGTHIREAVRILKSK